MVRSYNNSARRVVACTTDLDNNMRVDNSVMNEYLRIDTHLFVLHFCTYHSIHRIFACAASILNSFARWRSRACAAVNATMLRAVRKQTYTHCDDDYIIAILINANH